MSATSGAIDYLMAQLPAVVAAVDPTGVVQEGYALTIVKTMVLVACADPEINDAASKTNIFVTIGGHRLEEAFDIPCYIDCGEGGTDQSITRKRALLILDGIVNLIKGDPTLAALTGVLPCVITDITLTSTSEQDAPEGRRTVIRFHLVGKARI